MMGCDAPISAERVAAGEYHILGGDKLDRCPMALLRLPFARQVSEAYGWWKSGQLGLVCARPSAKMADGLAILDAEVERQARVRAEMRREGE